MSVRSNVSMVMAVKHAFGAMIVSQTLKVSTTVAFVKHALVVNNASVDTMYDVRVSLTFRLSDTVTSVKQAFTAVMSVRSNVSIVMAVKHAFGAMIVSQTLKVSTTVAFVKHALVDNNASVDTMYDVRLSLTFRLSDTVTSVKQAFMTVMSVRSNVSMVMAVKHAFGAMIVSQTLKVSTTVAFVKHVLVDNNASVDTIYDVRVSLTFRLSDTVTSVKQAFTAVMSVRSNVSIVMAVKHAFGAMIVSQSLKVSTTVAFVKHALVDNNASVDTMYDVRVSLTFRLSDTVTSVKQAFTVVMSVRSNVSMVMAVKHAFGAMIVSQTLKVSTTVAFVKHALVDNNASVDTMYDVRVSLTFRLSDTVTSVKQAFTAVMSVRSNVTMVMVVKHAFGAMIVSHTLKVSTTVAFVKHALVDNNASVDTMYDVRVSLTFRLSDTVTSVKQAFTAVMSVRSNVSIVMAVKHAFGAMIVSQTLKVSTTVTFVKHALVDNNASVDTMYDVRVSLTFRLSDTVTSVKQAFTAVMSVRSNVSMVMAVKHAFGAMIVSQTLKVSTTVAFVKHALVDNNASVDTMYDVRVSLTFRLSDTVTSVKQAFMTVMSVRSNVSMVMAVKHAFGAMIVSQTLKVSTTVAFVKHVLVDNNASVDTIYDVRVSLTFRLSDTVTSVKQAFTAVMSVRSNVSIVMAVKHAFGAMIVSQTLKVSTTVAFVKHALVDNNASVDTMYDVRLSLTFRLSDTVTSVKQAFMTVMSVRSNVSMVMAVKHAFGAMIVSQTLKVSTTVAFVKHVLVDNNASVDTIYDVRVSLTFRLSDTVTSVKQAFTAVMSVRSNVSIVMAVKHAFGAMIVSQTLKVSTTVAFVKHALVDNNASVDTIYDVRVSLTFRLSDTVTSVKQAFTVVMSVRSNVSMVMAVKHAFGTMIVSQTLKVSTTVAFVKHALVDNNASVDTMYDVRISLTFRLSDTVTSVKQAFTAVMSVRSNVSIVMAVKHAFSAMIVSQTLKVSTTVAFVKHALVDNNASVDTMYDVRVSLTFRLSDTVTSVKQAFTAVMSVRSNVSIVMAVKHAFGAMIVSQTLKVSTTVAFVKHALVDNNASVDTMYDVRVSLTFRLSDTVTSVKQAFMTVMSVRSNVSMVMAVKHAFGAMIVSQTLKVSTTVAFVKHVLVDNNASVDTIYDVRVSLTFRLSDTVTSVKQAFTAVMSVRSNVSIVMAVKHAFGAMIVSQTLKVSTTVAFVKHALVDNNASVDTMYDVRVSLTFRLSDTVTSVKQAFTAVMPVRSNVSMVMTVKHAFGAMIVSQTLKVSTTVVFVKHALVDNNASVDTMYDVRVSLTFRLSDTVTSVKQAFTAVMSVRSNVTMVMVVKHAFGAMIVSHTLKVSTTVAFVKHALVDNNASVDTMYDVRVSLTFRLSDTVTSVKQAFTAVMSVRSNVSIVMAVKRAFGAMIVSQTLKVSTTVAFVKHALVDNNASVDTMYDVRVSLTFRLSDTVTSVKQAFTAVMSVRSNVSMVMAVKHAFGAMIVSQTLKVSTTVAFVKHALVDNNASVDTMYDVRVSLTFRLSDTVTSVKQAFTAVMSVRSNVSIVMAVKHVFGAMIVSQTLKVSTTVAFVKHALVDNNASVDTMYDVRVSLTFRLSDTVTSVKQAFTAVMSVRSNVSIVMAVKHAFGAMIVSQTLKVSTTVAFVKHALVDNNASVDTMYDVRVSLTFRLSDTVTSVKQAFTAVMSVRSNVSMVMAVKHAFGAMIVSQTHKVSTTVALVKHALVDNNASVDTMYDVRVSLTFRLSDTVTSVKQAFTAVMPVRSNVSMVMTVKHAFGAMIVSQTLKVSTTVVFVKHALVDNNASVDTMYDVRVSLTFRLSDTVTSVKQAFTAVMPVRSNVSMVMTVKHAFGAMIVSQTLKVSTTVVFVKHALVDNNASVDTMYDVRVSLTFRLSDTVTSVKKAFTVDKSETIKLVMFAFCDIILSQTLNVSTIVALVKHALENNAVSEDII
ncbi:putative outer membrane protein [Heterosigma akashiwo virus 01]|uniref:Putative outer membrane protein n=1 Tax=Heterosigma akashiwo virus 01 TaxID=97195 RepID=A0A1C9C5G1_HAV01|nr:putative outer membrane protein [Heterosigma akashiwo virus 01]AOM63532.1 putative outer membrane protein [Heterosigma akashiwo virus 01]